MKTPRKSMLALTAAVLASVAAAQGWMTPATAAVQSAAALTVQRPDGTAFSMPITLDLLPYGTQQLGAATYMISNYEGSGTTVMIYAASPLRVASYGEMVSFQAQFSAAMRQLNQAPVVSAVPVSQMAAQPGQAQSGQAPSSQAPSSPVPAAALPTSAPVPQGPALSVSGTPVPAPHAPPLVWTSAVTQSQPAAPVMPTLAAPTPPAMTEPAVPATAPAAPTPEATASSTPASTTTAASQPRDAAAPTSLPGFLRGNFNGRVLKDGSVQITYSLVNRSRATTARLDPQDLRINQGGSFLAARLDARDSSGEPTMIPPSSGEIGTITFKNATGPGTPITLEWLVRDLTNDVTYPVRYRFTPTTTTASLQPAN